MEFLVKRGSGHKFHKILGTFSSRVILNRPFWCFVKKTKVMESVRHFWKVLDSINFENGSFVSLLPNKFAFCHFELTLLFPTGKDSHQNQVKFQTTTCFYEHKGTSCLLVRTSQRLAKPVVVPPTLDCYCCMPVSLSAHDMFLWYLLVSVCASISCVDT